MQLELFNPGVKRNDVPVKLETVTNKITFRKLVTIDNLEHNMLIHGYLRALHDYIFDFGLENTACYMISRSGIAKEDLIRCQLETEWNNEKMLAIIEKAFLKNPEDDQEEKERRLPYTDDRLKAMIKKSLEKKTYDRNYIPKVNFNYENFLNLKKKR